MTAPVPVQAEAFWKFRAQALGLNLLYNEETRELTCPRCEKKANILEFKTLGVVQKFAAFLAQIYKCPSCAHLFALLQ